jgi:hypothetical protein
MTEILPVQYIKFNTKRAFGIELEVNRKVTLEALVQAVRDADPKRHCIGINHYQQDHGNDYWHCKFDRSCGDRTGTGGWEVASYKASGAKQLLKIADMGTILSKMGAEVNDNCGYHIHVEIADFTASQAATLVANWMRLERMICEILPKGRRSNIYCRLLSDMKPVLSSDLENPISFWDRVRPRTFDNSERRVALNMCNYALGNSAKRTAELRLPEGTLDPKEIKNWARMFIHFVGFCRKAPWPKTIAPVPDLKSAATVLGLHNEDPFFILSRGLYETKTWFLGRALKHSAKKTIKSEAQEFLNFILPPVDKVEAKPLKKKVITIKERRYTGQLHEDDFWQPYDYPS